MNYSICNVQNSVCFGQDLYPIVVLSTMDSGFINKYSTVQYKFMP